MITRDTEARPIIADVIDVKSIAADISPMDSLKSALPQELQDLRAVDDSQAFKSTAPKRRMGYEYCNNCASEQAGSYEEGSKLKLCYLCRTITILEN